MSCCPAECVGEFLWGTPLARDMPMVGWVLMRVLAGEGVAALLIYQVATALPMGLLLR